MPKYTIPRFQNTALVVLTYGPLDITARQLCVTVVAVLLAANLWSVLSWLALAPAVLIVPFGWVSLAGRPLEAWLLVLLRYWFTPRVYTWPQEGVASQSEREQ